MYYVRKTCKHASGWHYVREEQEVLDENVECSEHPSSNMEDFVIEKDVP